MKKKSNNKKLLIFHPCLAPYRIDLYNALSETFEIFALLTVKDSVKKQLGFDLGHVNGQAKFNYLYFSKGFYLGNHLISTIYLKIIRSFKPDIVLASELGVNTLLAILFKRVFKYKLIVTVDDSPSMLENYSVFRTLLQRFVFRWSDIILVVHPIVEAQLGKKYCSGLYGNIVYFPIIQNEEKLKEDFKNSKREKNELYYKYNLEKKKVVLFVGRLVSEKCPDLLLTVFAKCNFTDTVLVFVGDGPLKKQLETYTKERCLCSIVKFTGRLTGSKLYAWYSLSDIFVLPSMFEPFGAVVNEALVAGCNVVVSDKVGSSGLVTKDNGVIFNSGDERGLAESLRFLLEKVVKNNFGNDLRKNMMQVSFRYYVDIFKSICTSSSGQEELKHNNR